MARCNKMLIILQNPPMAGRISDILTNDNNDVVVIVERFQILAMRDEIYNMPVLIRPYSEVTSVMIPVKV